MKNTVLQLAALSAATLLLAACSGDDSDQGVSGNGDLVLEFDNVYDGNNLELNAPYTTSSGESISLNEVKYFVSNIRLETAGGTIFTYPKSDSYFIVDEANETSTELELHNVPAGDYKSVTFGIGVDQQQYELGSGSQGSIGELGQVGGLYDNWGSGYIAVSFTGNFTSPSVTSETPFSIRIGKTASAYNYREVTLTFPEKALVRTNITPEVHLFADISKAIDGMHPIAFGNFISDGMAPLPESEYAETWMNIAGMFSVNHVHND